MRFITKFIAAVVLCATAVTPTRADIASVAAVHKYVTQKWDITIPYKETNGTNVVSMKYLMGLVDTANAMFNGDGNTSYATQEKYASGVAASSAAQQAIDEFIVPEYKFFFTPATDEYIYTFQIGAAGVFAIDWADGNVEIIQKDDTNARNITHTYTDAPANTHEIKLGGRATKYGTNTTAIEFFDGNGSNNEWGLSDMRGCLGCVFSTITDESVAENARQPRFYQTFMYNAKLTSEIPAELFSGITGAHSSGMFYQTFLYCSGLTGEIPPDLFSGIQGAPQNMLFSGTFDGCSGLSGKIPEGLFAGIKGAPASRMFQDTFKDCSGLSGAIPAGLFAGIKGAPASEMFRGTFSGCTGLTGEIPGNLFANIAGEPKVFMFANTFHGCKNLSGSIPVDLFVGISGTPANEMFLATFSNCSGLTGEIPGELFKGISGTPASEMFRETFSGCTGLTGEIPGKLFAGVSGVPAYQMFRYTFYGCSGLTSIPSNLFANITPSDNYETNMFINTFSNCTSLTGYSPKINGQYLYEIWPDVTNQLTYGNDTGLSDYACIPKGWGGGGTKNPGECEPAPEEPDDTGDE